ncbi:MAG: DUF3108 domain-containing protein [Candidatus Cloacimonetes bacterium]|nr:DUF3108 domain-containing protein [Candidatus Cloacimonadota bacterium]
MFICILRAEKLYLNIKYLGLNVVKVEISNNNLDQLTVKARSTALASIAAGMDNTYSIVYEDNHLPRLYTKKINQKNYTEAREIFYDREKLLAYRTSFLDPARSSIYSIREESRDFFSALFYLPSRLDEEQGEFWIDAARVTWKATFVNLGKEVLNTAIGRLPTTKVRIEFQKSSAEEPERSDMLTNNLVSENNSLYIWYSDDDKAIPVKARFNMSPFPVVWKLESYVP